MQLDWLKTQGGNEGVELGVTCALSAKLRCLAAGNHWMDEWADWIGRKQVGSSGE